MFTQGYMHDPITTSVTVLGGTDRGVALVADDALVLEMTEPGIVATLTSDTVLAVGCPEP